MVERAGRYVVDKQFLVASLLSGGGNGFAGGRLVKAPCSDCFINAMHMHSAAPAHDLLASLCSGHQTACSGQVACSS